MLSQQESINYVMLCRFIWENIEVDRIISAFSFSNYGLTAVQFFNPILLVYYKTLSKKLYRAFSWQANRLTLNIPVLQGLLMVNRKAEKDA